MRALRLGCLACLFAALAACAGTPDARTEEADLALRQGDPERAFALYEAALSVRPGDRLLAEKVAVARTESAELHLERARDLASVGRYEDANGEIALARRWTPDDPRIDGREAELAKIQAETTAGVDRAIAEANAALSTGAAGTALAVLARARARHGALPALMEAESRTRREISERLATRADAALAAGHPALATLFYRAAAQVDGSAPAGLARAEAAFAANLGATASIAEVKDSTGGRASPTALAGLVARELGDHLPSPAWTVATGAPGDLTVTIDVTRLDVGDIAPRTERKRVDYVIRVEQRENVTKARLRTSEQNLVRRYRQARSVHEATADELRSLEELGGSAEIRARGSRRYGPYSEAAYYRYLGEARAREALARNALEAIRLQLDETRARIATEPDWLEVPIQAHATTDVTTHGRTAAAEATVVIVTAAGETSGPLRAEVTATDPAHAAIPASGIPADPVSLPGESEIAQKALDALAARIAESVAEKAADLRRGLLAEADRRESAGDGAGALDHYASFLLAAGEGLPIERGRAASEVEARTGIRLAGSGLDIQNLRIE